MAKIFDETCALVERIPTLDLTVHFFWSVMANALTPEDRVKVLEKLIDIVTEETKNEK